MSEGWVYLLTNVAMPGYVKIGFTAQDDWRARLKQLDRTSVPMPFEAAFVARVPDCQRLERTLHYVFGDKRTRTNREFFRIDPDVAKAIIELVAIEETAVQDLEQAIAPDQRLEIDDAKARTQPSTLAGLGLKPGAVLSFIRDTTITCTVAGDKTVLFDGQEMSVSKAALTAIRSMGYTWPTVNGFDYWTYGGRKLSALSKDPIDEDDLPAQQ